MVRRTYCTACDAAVAWTGEWPGTCAVCGAPIPADPVADLVRPDLQVLFVGINPGVRTARDGVHFANPRNTFWRLLHESGLVPEEVPATEQQRLLDTYHMGVTNVVTRATPGSADIVAEDVRRGRTRLRRVVEEVAPQWVAFVGKQAFTMATGEKRAAHGVVDGGFAGRPAFVLPSTSPANAAVSPEEKLAWFVRLREALG